MIRLVRFAALAAAVALLGATSAPASAALRGEGTLHIHDSEDCTGPGEDSTVTVPFSGLFTGFAPNTTGTVSAYAQPGGQLVGQRQVTVDAQGNRCELVTGVDVPPGQYKIVYDFGSGTGKQKVIHIAGSTEPTQTPTLDPTETPIESPSEIPSQSPTESASETTEPPTAESPSQTGPANPSSTGSGATPGGSSSATTSASPGSGTAVEDEQLVFHELADPVGDAATLPKTGAGDVGWLLALSAGPAAAGGALLVATRRRGRHA
jgi:LPXTG-motif cell wall-anchored protein